MKKIILSVFLFTIHSTLFAQCRLSTEKGSYEATCMKELIKPHYTSSGIYIAIARVRDSGYFIIKNEDVFGTGFHKNIYLFLDDGSRIKLIDRHLRWKVNDDLYGQYYLTKSEIERLKRTNIRAVRYWKCYDTGNGCYETPGQGALEVYNKAYQTIISHEWKDRINFPKLIRNLYDSD